MDAGAPVHPRAGLLIHYVMVGVALERPPKIDQLRAYEIEAASWEDARLDALLISYHNSVMPCWAGIEEELQFIPDDWFR